MATDKRDENRDENIDYTAEGRTPPRDKEDPTNAGYDEAAHTGDGRYGIPEGQGGVFGTTGGGTYAGGMHVEERPALSSERGKDEPADDERGRMGSNVKGE
jgi:hypothetical protein